MYVYICVCLDVYQHCAWMVSLSQSLAQTYGMTGISLTLVWEGTTLEEKDVVFLGGEAVLCGGCVSDAHGSGILGLRLTWVRQITSACASWRPAPVEHVDMFMLDGV